MTTRSPDITLDAGDRRMFQLGIDPFGDPTDILIALGDLMMKVEKEWEEETKPSSDDGAAGEESPRDP